MDAETEVLVVGAGPTGLTLATLLHRAGVACRVIDKAAGPSTTSKAIGLQYRVSEILAWMGLVDAFLERAAEQSVVNIVAEPGRELGRGAARLVLGTLTQRCGEGGFAPRPIILPQSTTEELLGAALTASGGEVEWGHELVSFRDQETSIVAELAGGARVTAKYLISCEGAHSVARKRSGIAFDGKTYPHDFVMADVAMRTRLRRGEAYSWLHPSGVVSAITMPGEDRWRLFIEAGETHVGEVTLDAVRSLYATRTGDHASEIEDPTWLTRFKIHSRMVDRFRSGRVFLAGDAAHLHSPSGGQGITTGMQDAVNLAWKLAHVLRRGAPDALLDTYDEERRPAARAVLAATDANTRRLFATGAFAKWFRNRVFIPLLGTRVVQSRLVGKLSQLDVGYRASSLTLRAAFARGPGVRSGDRAPDVALTGADAPTLFGLLRAGAVVALLARRDARLEQALDRLGVRSHVLGDDVRARRVYGGRTDFWLVRPDGYVLLRASTRRLDLARAAAEKLWCETSVAAAFGPAPRAPVVTALRLAIAAVCVQFVALLFTLAEIVRLRAR